VSFHEQVVELRSVTKSFTQGSQTSTILNDLSFTIHKGESVAIVGSSGSGKSTLLHILGFLDRPSSGDIFFKSRKCTDINDLELTMLRRRIGFIYQFHHLLPEFSALENLIIARAISSDSYPAEHKELLTYLERFNLQNKQHSKPSELSGGEKQRVAIARALVNNPEIILSDEPTGNLDEVNAELVFDLLLENARLNNVAIVIVTHNMQLAKKADKIFTLSGGKLEAA